MLPGRLSFGSALDNNYRSNYLFNGLSGSSILVFIHLLNRIFIQVVLPLFQRILRHRVFVHKFCRIDYADSAALYFPSSKVNPKTYLSPNVHQPTVLRTPKKPSHPPPNVNPNIIPPIEQRPTKNLPTTAQCLPKTLPPTANIHPKTFHQPPKDHLKPSGRLPTQRPSCPSIAQRPPKKPSHLTSDHIKGTRNN